MRYFKFPNGNSGIGNPPSLTTVAGALLGNRIAVRIHRGQDVDPCVVQQPLDVLIRAVAGHEVLDEVEQHLPTNGLVAMDIAHVLHIRLAHHVLVRRRADHHHPQIPALDGLPDGVQGRQVGIPGTCGPIVIRIK